MSPGPANNDDDDAPIGPDDVVKARITLRRFRWFRAGVVVVVAVASVVLLVLLAQEVAAVAPERAAEARVDGVVAQVEAWSVDPQTRLAPGTLIHRGSHGTVIETDDVVVLVVDGKVVARARHPSP